MAATPPQTVMGEKMNRVHLVLDLGIREQGGMKLREKVIVESGGTVDIVAQGKVTLQSNTQVEINSPLVTINGSTDVDINGGVVHIDGGQVRLNDAPLGGGYTP